MAPINSPLTRVEATPPRCQPKRRMLGWGQPVLESAVSQLLHSHAVNDTWDMRQLLIVLPGGLAGRRLGELLAMSAKSHGKLLYPPQIVTVGALPEQLYVAKFPFASELVQHLSWLKALQGSPLSELTQIIPAPPPKTAPQQWLELAKIFTGLHRELASDGLNFHQVVKTLGNHPETPRWEALAKIQSRYLATLDDLKLWDIQTARLCALQYNEPKTSKQIIVIGCVDLNRTQRGFLEQVAESIEVWIAAPESASNLFDEFGGLHSSAWQDYELEIADDDLLVGNSPSDQAELTCAAIAELGDRYHTREVTIGVPDPALITELKHHLDQVGLKSRFGPGTALTQTEPALLLSLLGQYVDTSAFASFAALIRHPAITSMLSTMKVELPPDWLAQVDQYYQAALPKQVDSFINEAAKGASVARTVAGVINRWLAKLTARPRPISNWVQPLLSVMSAAYEKQMCDLDDAIEGPLFAAATQLSEAILSLRDIPQELEPSMKVSELIEWLLRSLNNSLVPEPAEMSALEMLGWLELALDDAPVLIVAGIHDGVVPESANADAFLPNALRRQLGMMDNARRFARDVYAMQVMLKSRQRVRFVVGKTDANGDPLVPSRLLMACGLAKLPNRVLHLVQEDEVDMLPAVDKRWKRSHKPSSLIVPRPANVRIPRQMSVTAFRDYLACPYRFYLRHVLKLREEQDADAELDAPMFGNLLHDTLQLLGEGPISRSADVEEIRDFLVSKLHEVALARFGPNPPSAVLIQIEQAEQRLEAFAPRQAERAAQGWVIRYTEQGVGFEDKVMLGHDEQLHLIGRIDRIDYHPQSGQWAIWDYKTSDNAKNPVSVHWTKADKWKDLQLPLYRPVAQKLGVGEHPSLGYIALPKQAADVGFYIADFTPEQLREADAVANEVAAKVLAGEFWPDKLAVPKYDDFARICQTNVQHVAVAPPQRKLTRHQSLVPIAEDVVTRATRLLSSNATSTPHFEPLLIRASAGTGKTFQLTNRLLQIVLSGQEVDQILASTFTRKAAGEIMHRVLQRLALGCINESTRSELEKHLPDVDVSAESCLAALRRVTRSIHRLRIGTLDSFFAQVARTFSLEMGLPPGWSAMDPIQEPQFQFQAIGQMLDNHDRQTLVGLVRMLAKGESGRQVSEQIRQTVSRGYAAFRVTTEEAWDQLPLPTAPSESAVDSALLTLKNSDLKNKSGSSNKQANENLQKLIDAASMGKWEAVVDHGIYGNIDEDPPTYYRSELGGGVLAALRLLLDRAAAEILPIRRHQTLASYKVLDAYDKEYTALVRRRRALAFSDVSYYLSRWMNAEPTATEKQVSRSAAQLAFRLDCGVQHLLLDEFQDTAPEQWQILKPLAVPLGGAASSDRSFFCVGDTKQAIYGWRGGVAEIFNSVGSSLSGLRQTQMSDSYRSSPEVMLAVNTVFQNLPNHANFAGCDDVAKAWSHEFPEHRTSRTSLPGYVCLQNGPNVDSGVQVEERKQIFLQYSAQRIAELTAQTDASVGVLFRTNADVGRMISLLRDLGVSASQDGGNPLTDSVAVELILSLIHLADHPGDGMCAFHVAASPLAAQKPLCDFATPHELALWFRRTVVRRGLGCAIELIANQLADVLSWWDQHRLEQLLRMAYEYQPSFNGRLRDFEDAVLRNRVALPTEAQVKVMTIHKSKGLEFDAVFLPLLDIDLSSSASLLVLRGDDPCAAPDGVLRYMNSRLQAMLPPSWQHAFNQQKRRGVVESLCLLYVAMTRARQALYMTTRPNGRAALQEFGSLLQSTLAGAQVRSESEKILYEDGSREWFAAKQPAPAQPKLAKLDDSLLALSRVALRQDAESAPTRGLRVSAPSTMQTESELKSLSSAFSYSHSVGITHGILMHAFFEQIQWLEDFQFDRESLRRVALAKVDPEALRHVSLEKIIDEFGEQLSTSSVRAALSRSRYKQRILGALPDKVEIDNERSLSIVLENKLIAGTIDRLAVLMQDGRPFAAEIFDFKTDTFDQRMSLLWLDDRVAHHRPQLELYAQVVARMFDLPRERIATYLIMLSSDNVVRCEGAGYTNAPLRPHILDHAVQATAAEN